MLPEFPHETHYSSGSIFPTTWVLSCSFRASTMPTCLTVLVSCHFLPAICLAVLTFTVVSFKETNSPHAPQKSWPSCCSKSHTIHAGRLVFSRTDTVLGLFDLPTLDMLAAAFGRIRRIPSTEQIDHVALFTEWRFAIEAAEEVDAP